MHRFMLLLGLGTALIAADACVQRPETPLTQAAARNDVAAIRRLLDDGHEADEGGDSWTALIWASRTGSIEAIKLLLDSGADVNLPGPTGDNWDATPLQHAILRRRGLDIAIGRRLAALLEAAGLEEVGVRAHAQRRPGDTDAAAAGGRRHRPHYPHIAARPRSRPDRRGRKRSHAAVSCGLRRHPQRTRPSDVWRLPRRNRARADRARSLTSFEAQFCLEQRDLVGALPEV